MSFKINSWEVPFVNVTYNKNFQTSINIKSENKITKMSVYLKERDPDFVSKSPEPFTRQQKLK